MSSHLRPFFEGGGRIVSNISFVFCLFFPKPTAMVMSGRSVHLSTLFSWANLNKRLTSTVHILSLVIDNNSLKWFSGREENGRRNYFMVNLHASMGNIMFKYQPTVEEINQTTTLNQPFQIELLSCQLSDSESNLQDRIKTASSYVKCTVQVNV